MLYTSRLLRTLVIGCALLGFGLAACSGSTGDAEAGRQLYMQDSIGSRGAPGCVTCHSLSPDDVKVGPTHAHIGSRAAQRVEAEDYSGQAQDAGAYLRESILEPDAYVVPGYEAGIMYQQYDQVLSTEQVDDLVAFLLSLE